ncbi:protein of unknown function [Hyphomicrobium sp. MC1]|nr:protein of unknown function [Hyphomicrobium sp. MC1]
MVAVLTVYSERVSTPKFPALRESSENRAEDSEIRRRHSANIPQSQKLKGPQHMFLSRERFVLHAGNSLGSRREAGGILMQPFAPDCFQAGAPIIVDVKTTKIVRVTIYGWFVDDVETRKAQAGRKGRTDRHPDHRPGARTPKAEARTQHH